MTTEPNNPDSAADSNNSASDTPTTQTDPAPILETLHKCSQLTQMLQQEDTEATQQAIPYPQLSGPSQNAIPAQHAPTQVHSNILRAEFCRLDVTQETLAGLSSGDVLLSSERLEQPVVVYRGNHIIATAELTVHNGEYVLTITSTSHDSISPSAQ
ncbi:MAG: FliM/FliN family flagellar motor switch protein [Planctomycetaceae bacterium]|jgi:flagellar motor switch/type III secretory pathway protein FliN|nr:FliM/FliN family flagellar motor switch protein [Planctomycetaceae bacterium]MBT4012709.1 FliM/FliN family flagellar motor switch protein [Planctomycetaceae bacterium]MBT4724931.1 FliM/FliN family flagellar motor switch protein [Planctomycetaceae bacterium]MBT4845342.1 FliM/FliN family flagellar motor switch protein [Planctomycetaceae bacterium]MBT5123845.1 FliM/FliN family flagellar motor switch protein [Planctomycetaceae bacterium]